MALPPPNARSGRPRLSLPPHVLAAAPEALPGAAPRVVVDGQDLHRADLDADPHWMQLLLPLWRAWVCAKRWTSMPICGARALAQPMPAVRADRHLGEAPAEDLHPGAEGQRKRHHTRLPRTGKATPSTPASQKSTMRAYQDGAKPGGAGRLSDDPGVVEDRQRRHERDDAARPLRLLGGARVARGVASSHRGLRQAAAATGRSSARRSAGRRAGRRRRGGRRPPSTAAPWWCAGRGSAGHVHQDHGDGGRGRSGRTASRRSMTRGGLGDHRRGRRAGRG